MKESKKLNQDTGTEVLDTDLQPESFADAELKEPSIEPGKQQEQQEQEDTKEIEKLEHEIGDFLDKEKTRQLEQEDPGVVKQRITGYQRRYLPDYLQKKPGLLSNALKGILKIIERNTETEGAENIPEDECLIICNHFGGGNMGMGDSAAISAAFRKKNVHLGVGKNIWWDQNPALRWLFKKVGLIPVEESLDNISEEEREESLKRQNKYGQKVFRKIIDKKKQGGLSNKTEFVRQAVAVLSKGEAVGIYPEGLWLNPEGKTREKQELKQGYTGVELIASQYKKLTGRELKIVPTVFIEDRKTGKKKFVIGKNFVSSENNSGMSLTDYGMSKIAGMLPKEQRGYYKDKVAAIEK